MARDGIDRRALDKFVNNLQREFDKRPIRIAVEADVPELPHVGSGTTVNNYNGPVFNGDVSGAQIAWNNETVTQNQQNTSTVAPGYEALAKFVTDLLPQLPQLGLDRQDLQDAEAAASDVLAEITQPEPEPGRVRRTINTLKGALLTGTASGLSSAAGDFVQTALAGLTALGAGLF